MVYPTGSVATFTYELHEADRGQAKFNAKTADLYSDVYNGRPVRAVKRVPFAIDSRGQDGVYVKIRFTPACTIDPQKPCAFDLGIYQRTSTNDTVGKPVFGTRSLTDNSEQVVYLANGLYFLTGEPNGYYTVNDTLSYHPYEMHVRWNEQTGASNRNIGGLRVSRTEIYEPVSGKTSVKTYTYNDASGLTTGRVLNLPSYGYQYAEDYTVSSSTSEGNTFTTVYNDVYYLRSSAAVTPMGLTQGSNVGYGQVTVWHGEWDNGYAIAPGYNGMSVYRYTDPGSYPDRDVVMGYPFSPSESREWMRGELLEATDYKRISNTAYQPVKKTTYEYLFYDESSNNPNVSNCRGLKVAFSRKSEGLQGDYIYKYFNFYTGYKELVKTTAIVYDPVNPSLYTSKESRYTYSPVHLQMVNVEETVSGKSRQGSYITYPPDYADNTGFIGDLKNAGIISLPIEQVVYSADSLGNVSILDGQLSVYRQGGQGWKEADYAMETQAPVALSNFRFSCRDTKGIVPTSGTASYFWLDTSLYKKQMSYDVYDSKGRLLQSTDHDGVSSAIIIGYNNTVPVAQAVNAQLTQIAYAGFEQGESGWQNVQTANLVNAATEPTNVYTGSYAYRLDKVATGNTFYGPVLRVAAPSGQGRYKLTCRIKTPTGYTSGKAYLNLYASKKGDATYTAFPAVAANSAMLALPSTGNQWQYFETLLDLDKLNVSGYELSLQSQIGNTDSNVPVYIDDITLSPDDALMSTATYEELVGLSSRSNGKSTAFYRYDGLGRLIFATDRRGNIIAAPSYSE